LKENVGPKITIQDPPGFIVRPEVQKAAFDNGFRLDRGIHGGWMRYGSTTAQGDIWIAGASPAGPWLLSLERNVVVAEIGLVSTAYGLFMGPSIQPSFSKDSTTSILLWITSIDLQPACPTLHCNDSVQKPYTCPAQLRRSASL
jgi:hypothetical protein